MRPVQYTEYYLVTGILNGTYPPGSDLPSERKLAGDIGVTRQTLREVLQRLARDRWITIMHGKPTRVNDYWREGGMGMLATLVQYPEYIPREFIRHLLCAREMLMPVCAGPAVAENREMFRAFLESGPASVDDAQAMADHDWELQSMMVFHSGNMVYPLMHNDFAPVFKIMGHRYFSLEKSRSASVMYYERLLNAVINYEDVRSVVKRAMAESIVIWDELQEAVDDRPN